MAYIYRLKDKEDIIFYIGYANKDLTNTIKELFKPGILTKRFYRRIEKIEFQKYQNEDLAKDMKDIYINKYRPVYNSEEFKSEFIKNLDFDINEKQWELYARRKTKEEMKEDFYSKYGVIMLIGSYLSVVVYIVIKKFF